jgi:hypothetical protein
MPNRFLSFFRSCKHFLYALCFILTSCRHDNSCFTLKLFSLKAEYEIDSIENDEQSGSYLIGIAENRPFGNFEYHLAIAKTTSKRGNVVYSIENFRNSYRVSYNYLALVKPYGVTNWGWFLIDSGKIGKELPGMMSILDSLESNEKLYMNERNGYIVFYEKEKVVKRLNYGNFVTKYKYLNFDSLPYQIYKLDGDSLIIASKDGNSLFSQKNGVYFVPSPGYGVVCKVEKMKVYRAFDSVFNSKSLPNTFKVFE